ncbi:MAG: hypothetical protein RLZZ301_88 [Bacteroidota bacterium]|jgi:hypothetical protein
MKLFIAFFLTVGSKFLLAQEFDGIKATKSLNQVEIGSMEAFDKLPKLEYVEITAHEFESVRQENNFKLPNQIQHLQKQDGLDYLGFYPTLKVHAFSEHWTSDDFGFEQLYLLDSSRNYKYNISSFGDGRVELAMPTQHPKYLVYYYNSLFDQGQADIGVLTVNDQAEPATYLTEFSSCQMPDVSIEEIIWKSDTSFYLKGYQPRFVNEKWVRTPVYFQFQLNTK